MTTAGYWYLGIIALATLVTACIQVGAILFAIGLIGFLARSHVESPG